MSLLHCKDTAFVPVGHRTTHTFCHERNTFRPHYSPGTVKSIHFKLGKNCL